MNIVRDTLCWEEPFEPMDMPDLEMLLPAAEWHDHIATQLARSGSDLAPFHRKTARCLRDLHDYMRQLDTILRDDDEILDHASIWESMH